jgi:hypothetical protein
MEGENSSSASTQSFETPPLQSPSENRFKPYVSKRFKNRFDEQKSNVKKDVPIETPLLLSETKTEVKTATEMKNTNQFVLPTQEHNRSSAIMRSLSKQNIQTNTSSHTLSIIRQKLSSTT